MKRSQSQYPKVPIDKIFPKEYKTDFKSYNFAMHSFGWDLHFIPSYLSIFSNCFIEGNTYTSLDHNQRSCNNLFWFYSIALLSCQQCFIEAFLFKSFDLVLNFSECDIIWKLKLQHCSRSSVNKRFVNSLEDLHRNDTFTKDKCESCWGQLSNNRNSFIFYCFKLLALNYSLAQQTNNLLENGFSSHHKEQMLTNLST